MLDDYVRVARFPVSFSDVDMNRHANNVAYLRWAEQGRVEYTSEILDEEISGSRGFILRKTEIVYDRPLARAERVAFGTRVARIGTRSMDFRHDCVSEDAGLVCAQITCVVVGFNYVTNQSMAIPQEWIDQIVAFERVAPARS